MNARPGAECVPEDADCRGIGEVLWQDGEHLLRRGWRYQGRPVLALLPAAEHPASRSLDRLTHEYGLRDDLRGEWALMPIDLVRGPGQTGLLLEDPGGEPLQRHVGSPMELGRFLRLAQATASALAQLHARGLVHKDLKPVHIFVTEATAVRLTGFGIASRLPRERQALEAPEIIAGTLAYMAPEQTGRMNRSVDSRSDLYSLGVIFYQMLTGALPFTASDPMGWVHAHIARLPVTPAERAGVPAAVSDIVMKLLAKTAEDRYQTAAGAAADLRRCLQMHETAGKVEGFPLGAQDVPDVLRIPEKLYGREQEVATLLAAFDRVVASGTTELVLVSGYSGIGKSSVVNELHKVIVPPRGLFASGKFEQYRRDVPYATLAQAFQTLVRQVLARSESEVAAWRNALREALGGSGELMVRIIPELELLIGRPPPVPELPPQEAQARFLRVFRRLLGVFARPEHPVVLFLDDLQWLDAASLKLLADLATQTDVRHLLLVGAYRDNEVDASHPLMRSLDEIRSAGAVVNDIVLTPLALRDVSALVADALHWDGGRALHLADLVHEKTGGNPFFAIHFLGALAEEKLLFFDTDGGAWTADLERIHAKGYTDNVIDLMVAKLGRLPTNTREGLKQLACLGNGAGYAILGPIFNRPTDAVHASLWPAVRDGLVLHIPGSYAFVHDRVQEAAYAQIDASSRARTHLRIGRLLMAQLEAEPRAEQVFATVNQLNRAVALIQDRQERAALLRLNVLAGTKARASIAYAAARTYLAQAAALIEADAWTAGYEDTFHLHLALSECEYLLTNFERAEELFELMLLRARSDLDRAQVYSLRMKVYQVAGKYDEGMTVALQALQLFGVDFPQADEAVREATDAEARNTLASLEGRSLSEILDAPPAADPAIRAVINLLVDALPCAYIARPKLFPLVAMKAVNHSLRGNTDQSSFAYAVYALMVISGGGDTEWAFRFSEMALRLNDRFDNVRLRGTLLHLHGDHINFWRRHFVTGMPILEEAFRACLEAGDLVYAGFLAFETVWQAVERGDSLAEVRAVSEKNLAFAQESHNGPVYETIRLEQQFIASLQGRTSDPLRLDENGFDEAASLAAIEQATFGCGVVFHRVMKQILAFFYGRYGDALEEAARAEQVLSAAMAMPIEATYHFFHALTLAALHSSAPSPRQQEYVLLLRAKLDKLKRWSDNCPENYRNRYALVAAEFARIEERNEDAMRLYEDAIHSARENGFVHNEALACELAARFYAARGFEDIGNLYLRKARGGYMRWGAAGKVRQIDESLLDARDEAAGAPSTSTIGAPVEQLDLTTVIKVSQSVTGEIVLEKLLETLMRTAIEHAGAERGLLILPQAGEQRIVAEATTAGERVVVHVVEQPVAAELLPQSVFQYVLRTQDRVILDDAAAQGPFANDPYIREHRARSVLCLPLLNRGKPIGALYLENNLAPRVFMPSRIAILKLLASQAAISLENSRLYRDLAEREARIRRLVDANIIGIFIWDFSGRILVANDAFLRIVDYDREDLDCGRMRWTDLTPPEWQDRDIRELVPQIKSAGSLQPFEKEYYRKDGSRVPVLIGAALFEHGTEGVAFVLDLTERNRAEAEARDSERRSHEMQMRLADANRLASIGQLSASIAHEMNQPLAGIVANANTCARRLDADPPNVTGAAEVARRLIRDADRASDVIKRLRALFGKKETATEWVDVNQAVREVMALAATALQLERVALSCDFDQDLPLVEGDRVQLQQVIMNLLRNATDAMAAVDDGERRLAIRTHRDDEGCIRLTVRDSGVGFDPQLKEKLFETFYTTKSGGMGIGLSVSRSIIERHQGRLWAEPNEGPGASFTFAIPVPRAEAQQP